MADAAWTKVFQDDLLHGCRAANMSGEEIGVYCTVLWLIASRGAPIEFDSRWISGFAGVTPRKATAVINKLAAMPNKLVVRNGMIGNRKMLRTVAERDKKSNQARAAALARWHGDDAELPLEIIGPIIPPDNRSDNREIIAPIKSRKSRKSANPSDADASRSVRARDSETQNHNTTHPNTLKSLDSVGSGRVIDDFRLADPILAALFTQVCDASGFAPATADQIGRAIGFVESWHRQGVDFETIVLPVIRAMTAESDQPTRTLGRFDRKIKFLHARQKSRRARPACKIEPVMKPAGEDIHFAPLRAALLKRLGTEAYCRYCNDVIFEDLGDEPGGRTIMRIRDPKLNALKLMDGERAAMMRDIARTHGWSDIW